jgi:protein-L-isoaspartate O-methyltransferase
VTLLVAADTRSVDSALQFGCAAERARVPRYRGCPDAMDVPPFPSPPHIVARMLELAQILPGDVLVDLGSGDGRIPIAAASAYGIRAIGYDLAPERIALARRNAGRADVAHLVQFFERDLLKADLTQATVVTLYLLTAVNLAVRPALLRDLRPGSRIVSYCFHMGAWEPDEIVRVDNRSLYRWRISEHAPVLTDTG